MLVVNPHSPTGKYLSRQEMEEVVQFCVENGLVLIAAEILNSLDESNTSLVSFANVISKMEKPYNQLALFSINSFSSSFNK